MAYGEVLWKTPRDGWVDISENERLIAILKNTENVPYGISGITKDYIAPSWVQDALKAYDEQGGFAGLSPGEYLDKMANEQVEEPRHSF